MALDIRITKRKCGFCMDGDHERKDGRNGCAINTASVVPHFQNPDGIVWVCPCECNTGRRKCTHCGNRNTNEVSDATYKCIDTEACHASVETRRAESPIMADIRAARKKAAMAKVENAEKAKKTAAPKEGTCVCGCKGKTKGGLFLPGHDARFVSQTVADVESKGFTKTNIASGLKVIKDAGASETLQAKYTKAVGLAQERADKRAAAAKEKADAKAEKAKEKAGK